MYVSYQEMLFGISLEFPSGIPYSDLTKKLFWISLHGYLLGILTGFCMESMLRFFLQNFLQKFSYGDSYGFTMGFLRELFLGIHPGTRSKHFSQKEPLESSRKLHRKNPRKELLEDSWTNFWKISFTHFRNKYENNPEKNSWRIASTHFKKIPK